MTALEDLACDLRIKLCNDRNQIRMARDPKLCLFESQNFSLRGIRIMFWLIDWVAKLIFGEEAVEKSRQRKVPRRSREK
jgi:hypothetical protein